MEELRSRSEDAVPGPAIKLWNQRDGWIKPKKSDRFDAVRTDVQWMRIDELNVDMKE